MSSSKTTSNTTSTQTPTFSGSSADLVSALNTRAKGNGLDPTADTFLTGLAGSGMPTQNNANINDIVNYNRNLEQYDTADQLGQFAGKTYRVADGARARGADNIVAGNEASLDNQEGQLRNADLNQQLTNQTNASSELFNDQAQSAAQQTALLAQQRGQNGAGSSSTVNTPNPVGTGLQIAGALYGGFSGMGAAGASGAAGGASAGAAANPYMQSWGNFMNGINSFKNSWGQ